MIKKLTFLITALFLLCFSFRALAYETPGAIMVGLDFGSEAKDSLVVLADGGALIGHVYEKEFYPQMSIDASEIVIEKGGGAYLRTKDEYESLEETIKIAQQIRKQGAYAYGGYIDGKYYVMFGLYGSIDEAKESVSNLEFTALELEAVSLDMKAVMISAQDFNMIFRHDKEMFSIGSASGKTVNVNGSEYYGYIVCDRIHSDKIAILNLVSTDDYVACVVGSEMYSTWHIEALKAQAVIARTYAMTTTSYKSYGIDVTDDTRSQAYYGLSRETESTRRAANETSGAVLLYKGAPAQTFFCASSGGKTADVYSAWGGGAGLDYLQSVEDKYEDSEKVAVWSVTYSADEIAQKLAKAGVDIGDVTNVVVLERGEKDERVRKLCFEGTEGSHTVTFEKCRTILGLKSQYYYIRSSRQTHSSTAFVINETGVKNIALKEVSVLSVAGQSALLEGASVLGAETTKHIQWTFGDKEDTYTFDGRGNGHGIGLSQYGAKGMAEAGFDYEQILLHYYVGTTLSN